MNYYLKVWATNKDVKMRYNYKPEIERGESEITLIQRVLDWRK